MKRTAAVLVADVEGILCAARGPNSHTYPFSYRRTVSLDASTLEAVSRPGRLPEATARALLSVLAGASDRLLEATAHVSPLGELTMSAVVEHSSWNRGTRRLEATLKGRIGPGRVDLRAVRVAVTGTWAWGGGDVGLHGEGSIRLEGLPGRAEAA